MELKAGYKQTEVGVIPEDWLHHPLGKVLKLQRGFDLPHRLRIKGEVPIITSSGFGEFHSEPRVQGPGVVTGRYGTIGEVFYISEDFWPLNTTLYVKDFFGNNQLYIYYLLRRIDFHSHSGKSGVPGVNRNDLHEIIVPLPPTKAEQQAIATALSDTDALIESLEQLIAKKRLIKQGTMQELLTGKRRLPGFSGEWVTKRFGNVVELRKNRINPKNSGEHEFCIELEHIGQANGCLTGHAVVHKDASLKSVFEKDDVLFGKLRAYLRKYWLASCKGVCSTEIWVFVAKRIHLVPAYLFQLIQMDKFVEAASSSYGTHMPRSDWSVVRAYQLDLPSIEEQTVIATVLSDLDTELNALESQLEKTRAIKQGMMQSLLTGRIRLLKASTPC